MPAIFLEVDSDAVASDLSVVLRCGLEKLESPVRGSRSDLFAQRRHLFLPQRLKS